MGLLSCQRISSVRTRMLDDYKGCMQRVVEKKVASSSSDLWLGVAAMIELSLLIAFYPDITAH